MTVTAGLNPPLIRTSGVPTGWVPPVIIPRTSGVPSLTGGIGINSDFTTFSRPILSTTATGGVDAGGVAATARFSGGPPGGIVGIIWPELVVHNSSRVATGSHEGCTSGAVPD